MRDIQPAVCILASGRDGTLYTGVASDLVKRIWQHREHLVDGFTKNHGVTNLVWYELHATMESAITREETDQEMEAIVENRINRICQSLLA